MPLLATPRRFWLILFSALFLARVPLLLVPKLIDDEQVYGVVAREILQGGKPYLTAIERKPPLLFYLYAAVLKVAGSRNWLALHATAILWTAATMAILYWILYRRFDRETGLTAAALYGLYAMWGDYRNLALNGELLMNLPIVLALAITLRETTGKARLELFLAGALIALATLIKQPAGIAGTALGAYVLSPSYRKSRGVSLPIAVWQALELLLGLLLTFGLAAWLLAGQGMLKEALYWSIEDHGSIVGATTSHYWWRAADTGSAWLLWTVPLLVAVWATQNERVGSWTWDRHRAEYQALIVLLVASVVAVGINGQFLVHYYLQLLPPLALLAAPIIRRWLERSDSLSLPHPHRDFLAGAVLLSLAAFPVVDSVGLWRNHRPTQAGQWVRTHSDPSARIFVWGQGDRKTGIYLDADRRPASRFISPFPMTGHVFGGYPKEWGEGYEDSRALPGAWDTLRLDFALHPPEFIIDAETPDKTSRYPVKRYRALMSLLQAEYRVVDSTSEGLIYQRLVHRQEDITARAK